jgi:hypothetical protein
MLKMNDDEIYDEIEKAVQSWLNDHKINILNLIIVSMMVSETISSDDTDKFKMSNKIYRMVLLYLLDIGKIDGDDVKHYKEEFHDRKELVLEFTKIIADITNNPNIINKNKWISDNLVGRIKNSCFPCMKIIPDN